MQSFRHKTDPSDGFLTDLDMLLKGEHFDARYFCVMTLDGIGANRLADATEDQRRRIVLHFGNASPHTIHHTTDFMNRNRLIRTSHQPFSPDLALRLLFLWEAENGADEGNIRQGTGAFRQCNAGFNTIPRQEHESIVDEWLRRLDACIERAGGYVE
jgi:hypothetical protein